MDLFRVFSWDGSSRGGRLGGPLFVPRRRQGAGRHDNPSHYGAFYCSLEPISCIAEALQPFRTQTLAESDLQRHPNLVLALVQLELSDSASLIDLDDPAELQRRGLRPSRVATLQRRLTQTQAAGLYDEGKTGFLWWSTLESTWINCTLFEERARPQLKLSGGPWTLTLQDTRLRAAAERLGIALRFSR